MGPARLLAAGPHLGLCQCRPGDSRGFHALTVGPGLLSREDRRDDRRPPPGAVAVQGGVHA